MSADPQSSWFSGKSTGDWGQDNSFDLINTAGRSECVMLHKMRPIRPIFQTLNKHATPNPIETTMLYIKIFTFNANQPREFFLPFPFIDMASDGDKKSDVRWRKRWTSKEECMKPNHCTHQRTLHVCLSSPGVAMRGFHKPLFLHTHGRVHSHFKRILYPHGRVH